MGTSSRSSEGKKALNRLPAPLVFSPSGWGGGATCTFQRFPPARGLSGES